MAEQTKVDQNGLKTGQALTIVILLLAFLIGESAWALVAFVAVAQLLGALNVSFAPYRVFYLLIKQAGWIKPNPQPDHAQPHRFAMLVGALFNGGATVALLLGNAVLGWSLVWVVIALANLNFWVNFCVGCWVYYQLNRLGVPGFTVSASVN